MGANSVKYGIVHNFTAEFYQKILINFYLRGRKKMAIFYAFFTTFRQFCQIFIIFRTPKRPPTTTLASPMLCWGLFWGLLPGDCTKTI